MTTTLVFGTNKGDLCYYDPGDMSWHVLSGDTDNVRRFLRYLSIGGAYEAPVWDQLIAGDIPSLPASIITSGILAQARGGLGKALDLTGLADGYSLKYDLATDTFVVGLIAGVTSGSTFPTSPLTGQLFLHTPTGRNILYEYDGSNWDPIISIGSMTLYVDGSGTNDLLHGTGTGTSAFKTLQYAINVIPATYGGSVTINVASGTFTEVPTINTKIPTGNYSILVYGTLTTSITGTASSGSQGASAGTLPTVTVAGTPWGANAYQNKLVIFDGNVTAALKGIERIIDSNTNNTLTLVGGIPAAPASGDTFTVYGWGTIISSSAAPTFSGISNLYFYHIEFSLNTAGYVVGTGFGSCVLTSCFITNSTAGNPSLFASNFASITLQSCYIYSLGNGAYSSGDGALAAINTKIVVNQAGAYVGIYVVSNSTFSGYDIIVDMTDKTQPNLGIDVITASSAFFSYTSNNSKNILRNCGTGIQVEKVAATQQASTLNYSNCTVNSNAIAASFGYLG